MLLGGGPESMGSAKISPSIMVFMLRISGTEVGVAAGESREVGDLIALPTGDFVSGSPALLTGTPAV